MTDVNLTHDYQNFIEDIKNRILTSRYQAARAVNKELILLYHHIGTQILEKQKAQGWGAKVIEHLSKDLKSHFPDMKGFSPRNLKYMRLFAREYSNLEFVQEVLAQLSWYHNVTILDKISDLEERRFYISQTIENGWSRNTMVTQITKKLHLRKGKAVTNFKHRLPVSQSDLANQTLKDPYILIFYTA